MSELTVKEKIEQKSLYDVAILRHGFAAHMRDYDVLIEAMWGLKEWGDAKGHYRCRFTHCVEAHYKTKVKDKFWIESWDELFTDYDTWEAAGAPNGFVWGTCWSMAYPGFLYRDDSELAEHWSQRLGKRMHEVRIETEAFELQLIFFDFNIAKLDDEVRVIDKVLIPIKSH
jgi:hypothetical protein